MRYFNAWIGAITLIGLVGVSACGEVKPDSAVLSPPRQVESLTVREQVVPDYKGVAAVITNRDAGDARARIGGKLTQLLVREGDVVRRNQLVALVSDERVGADARAASASVAAARASADQAALELARSEKLFAQQAIARAAVEAARAQALTASATLKAVRAQEDAARAVQGQGEIRAPADGKVLRAIIPQGSAVMAGDLIVAISTGAQVLRIELPEADARALAIGGSVTLLPEDGDRSAREVKVKQVYPAVTNGRVTADLDASGIDTSFIGARVRVMVAVGQRSAIVIPERFIDTRYGADYVRLSRAGVAIDAPIQRGGATPLPAMADGIEVLSGLRDGDVILLPERS